VHYPAVSVAQIIGALAMAAATAACHPFAPSIMFFVEGLTRRQRIAFGAYIAEFCLWPFIFILFAFARLFSSVTTRMLPNLWFLQKQYVLLTAKGFDSAVIALALRLFEFIVWISLSIILLRLVLAPLLLSPRDLRRTREKMRGRPVKVLFGWCLMLGGLWAATNVQGAKSVPLLSILMSASPYWYICFCALMFVIALFFVVEVPLLFIEIRLRRNCQGSPS
jgi:hypothetical protein